MGKYCHPYNTVCTLLEETDDNETLAFIYIAPHSEETYIVSFIDRHHYSLYLPIIMYNFRPIYIVSSRGPSNQRFGFTEKVVNFIVNH